MENKKIKICYVASVDLTLRFILFDQLKFLKKEGYDVSVVCSSGKWIKEIEQEEIKVKTIRFKRSINPFSDLITLVKLFFYFKKEKFDIVHTHTPKASLIGQLAAKMAGIPIIINTVHGFYFQKSDRWQKRIFFILINKITAMCSDLIFFVNEEDMKTAVNEHICSPDLIRYFGGGIDMDKFNPERFSKEFIFERKKQLGINTDHNIIGIVARLVREKGYIDLFEALEKVLKHFPNTTLLIVGFLEPEKKDAIGPDIIKNYNIEKNVIFLGERTDVNEIYALMDIFVLPSYREGLGISIIEASAMEKPVVATNIRGCREAIDDGLTGKLVAPGDSLALAQAIIYLMEHSEKAAQMGKNGRMKAMRQFDERLVFDRIIKEYQRLLNLKFNDLQPSRKK